MQHDAENQAEEADSVMARLARLLSRGTRRIYVIDDFIYNIKVTRSARFI